MSFLDILPIHQFPFGSGVQVGKDGLQIYSLALYAGPLLLE